MPTIHIAPARSALRVEERLKQPRILQMTAQTKAEMIARLIAIAIAMLTITSCAVVSKTIASGGEVRLQACRRQNCRAST